MSLYPISFVQSSPLVTYINKPNGRHFILIETGVLWESIRFQFVFDGKMVHCTPKKGKLKKPWKAANRINRRGEEISTLSINSSLTWERKKRQKSLLLKTICNFQRVVMT
jgi:hypothetical protein